MFVQVQKWNISNVGEYKPAMYRGFKYKKDAQEFCKLWNSHHDQKIEVIRMY